MTTELNGYERNIRKQAIKQVLSVVRDPQTAALNLLDAREKNQELRQTIRALQQTTRSLQESLRDEQTDRRVEWNNLAGVTVVLAMKELGLDKVEKPIDLTIPTEEIRALNESKLCVTLRVNEQDGITLNICSKKE
jgi:hypothetical protein